MYKVLVVDDEPMIARSVSRMIAKVSTAFEVAEICYDGETALKEMAAIRPELVISDIRMPRMDGLELAKEIQQTYPGTRVVILSGYGEFNYAVAAIKAGVVEYLMKPINRADLSQLLHKIEDQLNVEYLMAQTELLKKLMHHAAVSDARQKIDYLFRDEAYLMILICSGSYLHSSVEFVDTFAAQQQGDDMVEMIRQSAKAPSFWKLNGYKANEKVVLLGGTQQEITETAANLRKKWDEVQTWKRPITLVVSTFTKPDLMSIDAAVIELCLYLKNNLIFGTSAYLQMDHNLQLPATSDEKFALTQEEQQFLSLLFRERQLENLKQQLKKIIEKAETCSMHQVNLEELVKSILLAFLDQNSELMSFAECQNLVVQAVGNCTDYEGLFQEIWKAAEMMLELQKNFEYDHKDQNVLIRSIRKFIEENFTQPINLQTLAGEFGMVAPYLGKLYSDYYGTTVKQDILQLRLQKAEKLLAIDPPISCKEVAALSGFNDQFYFSKVFKKNCGVSPADYQKQHSM